MSPTSRRWTSWRPTAASSPGMWEAIRTARMRDIAAIRNEAGNVVGMMPHPEHAIDLLTGPSTDGLVMFASVLKSLAGAAA